jgi:L-fuculose-phosphate aldolase
MNRSTESRDPRLSVVEAAQALDAAGMMPNKSGNVSCRAGDALLITPAAIPYRDLDVGAIVEVPLHGGPPPEGDGLRPSSEWRMHAAIYQARADVGAIVHTHSPRATALACAGRGIPPFHYMIALAGGEVRCMPYATFGTAELATTAVQGLEDRNATLLSNHGVIAVGASLRMAQSVALEVENLAGQYLALLAAGLEARLLDAAELQRVLAKFAGYGRLG